MLRIYFDRHRQEILKKLQVRNSIEACRVAGEFGFVTKQSNRVAELLGDGYKLGMVRTKNKGNVVPNAVFVWQFGCH